VEISANISWDARTLADVFPNDKGLFDSPSIESLNFFKKRKENKGAMSPINHQNKKKKEREPFLM